jgi:hypothetical protein
MNSNFLYYLLKSKNEKAEIKIERNFLKNFTSDRQKQIQCFSRKLGKPKRMMS